MNQQQQQIPINQQQQQNSQQPNISNTYQSGSLYAGDLQPDVTEAYLYEIFREVGPIISIKVCRDAITRKSLGYAYVNFQNPHDAERALDTLNYTKVRGKPIRIMWSQRDPSLRKSGVGNIFIKNLDKVIDNKALYDTFSAFGNILSCKVEHTKRQNKDGTVESLGYGYVHFETKEAAEQAIAKVNGMLINGKKVYVGPFVKRHERIKQDSESKFTNIYINNFPKDLNKFAEKDLEELFKTYGEITSFVIMKDNEGKSKGFGFLNFKDHESARKSVEELNGKIVDGQTLLVTRAQKKEERKEELKKIYQNRYQGVNLYVKNLHDQLDDKQLKEIFGSFGEITSAIVMKDDSNNSRGFGFVCFAKPEEATKAITEMNGRMVGTKPLYVALAQRKDFRRAQLEAQHAQRIGLRPGGIPPQPMFGHGTPVFYSGIPQQRPYVYPPMMRPRWTNPNARPTNAPPQYPSQGIGIQPGLSPFTNMQQIPQNMQQFSQNRGPNQKPRRGPNQQQRRGYKYNQQVRNKPQDQQQLPQQQQNIQLQQSQQQQQNIQLQQQQPQQQPQNIVQPPPQLLQSQLTPDFLAQCPPQQQKRLLGERLYPLVHLSNSQLASKITGMILEMDNGDILHLLESEEALKHKIQQAVDAIKNHEQKQQVDQQMEQQIEQQIVQQIDQQVEQQEENGEDSTEQ